MRRSVGLESIHIWLGSHATNLNVLEYTEVMPLAPTLPRKPCRMTSELVTRAYAVAGQMGPTYTPRRSCSCSGLTHCVIWLLSSTGSRRQQHRQHSKAIQVLWLGGSSHENRPVIWNAKRKAWLPRHHPRKYGCRGGTLACGEVVMTVNQLSIRSPFLFGALQRLCCQLWQPRHVRLQWSSMNQRLSDYFCY